MLSENYHKFLAVTAWSFKTLKDNNALINPLPLIRKYNLRSLAFINTVSIYDYIYRGTW